MNKSPFAAWYRERNEKIVKLRLVDKLSYREIGDQFGITESTIKYIVAKARKAGKE